eukprot:SM005866S18746  [mRNA]  locus=s5866:119:878:+ [translate_table: standard]
MAFECPHCHERNSEVLFAGSLQPRGCRFTLSVARGDAQALNRQLVKADTATLTRSVPSLLLPAAPCRERLAAL